MLAFIGVYNCKADSKFRVSVPAMFRKIADAEGQNVWIVRRSYTDNCIDMYPLSVWSEFQQRLRAKLNPMKPQHVAFLREFYRDVHMLEADSNGRILLPKSILSAVGIDREMIMAGLDNKIQIWNAECYEALRMEHEDLAKLVQELFND